MQLPILGNLERQSLQKYFNDITDVLGDIKLNQTLYTADYIILPMHFSITESQSINIKMPIYPLKSKVIILSLNDQSLFVPCPPQNMECWIEKQSQLRWIPIGEQLIPSIDKGVLWNDIHSSVHTITTKLKKETSSFQTMTSCQPCNFSPNHKMKDLIVRRQDHSECSKCMIAIALNCTSYSCYHIFDVSHQYISSKKAMTKFKRPQNYVSFGCQFHGYRYSIVINKDQMKKS